MRHCASSTLTPTELSSDFLGKWECALNGGILGDVLPSLENTLLDSPDFTSKKRFFKAFVGYTIVLISIAAGEKGEKTIVLMLL